MLLILSAISLQRRLESGSPRLTLLDLPRFAHEQLGLNGLLLPTSMLAGADAELVDRLRDSADKAGCPCLVLVESTPQPLGQDDDASEAAVERMLRVMQAASRLGCSAAGLPIEAKDDEDSLSLASENCRRLLERADRLELNLLISPRKGLTETPERLALLMKKIGGFRVGSLPDFEAATKSDDAQDYLRRVTPYASAVLGATQGFTSGKHKSYDLKPLVESIVSVGFDGSLAIEHRGSGDPVEGLKAAREAMMELLGDRLS